MTIALDGPLAVIGAGKMGGALLEGWLRLGLDPNTVAVFDPGPPADTAALIARAGVRLNPDPAALDPPAVILLAVKPQMMAAALPPVAALAGPGTLVLSIMAGKTLAGIGALLPAGTAIIRAMPNTPAAIGRGATVAVTNEAVTPARSALADRLLAASGLVAWVEDEALIDAATALSGSGPAYVFHLVEAMAEAGAAAGLPADLAMRLARETVAGAGELLHRSDLPAATLRQNVTSPGGTTAAALSILMAGDGLAPLMRRAVAAAKARAIELAD